MNKVENSNSNLEKAVVSIQTQLASLVDAFNKSQHFSSQRFSSPQFSPQPHHSGTPSPSPFPLATPSPTHSPQSSHVLIKEVVSTKVIAKGELVTTLKGEKVYCRNIQDHESKTCVISVENNESETRLYLGSQGCATTIGEVIGGYVVWPTCFLERY